MKRMLSAIIALVMVMLGAAYADEGELHLLWGIEFGQGIETVQAILKNEHGLETEYSEMEYTDCLHESLKHASDGVTVSGYQVRRIQWDVYTYSDHQDEAVTIDFSNRSISELYGTSYEEGGAVNSFADILNTLVEQFGPIDFATYVINSEGTSGYILQKEDNIREVGHFTDLSIEALNPWNILDGVDYITENSSVIVSVYIDNIHVFCYADFKKYNISVCFRNSMYEDTVEDVYEDPREKAEDVKYEDKGF